MSADDLLEKLAFSCPRCAQSVTERFYGPCGACRDELAETQCHAARDVEAEPYVPKSNVTANFVATRE